MAEPSRPSTADTPGSEESTMFLPTRTNEGVGEDEHLAARPVLVDDDPGWRSSPWLWVAAGVLVLLSVPLLAHYSASGRGQRAAAARAAQASAVVVEPAPSELAQPTVAAEVAAPQPPAQNTVVVTRPAGQPPRPTADGPRQMVNKCIEGGRVVYTQTGACAGSVTAVPIDADKNVVGADRPAGEGVSTKAP